MTSASSNQRPSSGPQSLDIAGCQGLSQQEARVRLEQEGANELPSQDKRGLFAIALEVVKEPMFLMLVAAGALYLVMGEPSDALMLLGFVFVVMGITIVQERRTERALEALRDLSSPRALVIREGSAAPHPGARGGPGRFYRAGRRGPRPCGCGPARAASTCPWTNPC